MNSQAIRRTESEAAIAKLQQLISDFYSTNHASGHVGTLNCLLSAYFDPRNTPEGEDADCLADIVYGTSVVTTFLVSLYEAWESAKKFLPEPNNL